jgi:glucose-6-phosphate isomerase
MNKERDIVFDQLRHLKNRLDRLTMSELFALNPNRFEDFSIKYEDLLLDYSKNHIDKDVLNAFKDLSEAINLKDKINDMFTGKKINITENRAVLHIALRNKLDSSIFVDGKDIMPDVKDSLERMEEFVNGIRNGEILSSSGDKFTDVVNIGIGGSHLGPEMVTKALKPYHDGPKIHFVSNIDPSHIYDVISKLDPKKTLVLIASKTFVTIETMTNAKTALKWMSESVGKEKAGEHFVAISTALDKTKEFGISDDRVFGYWDWVGGRYSIWSSIGLCVILAIGMDNFREFLEGAHEMDQHFLNEPVETNMPIILGFLGVWHLNICNYVTRAILPYDQRLSTFPSYIQQLDMESNGKSITSDGENVSERTGVIIWGDAGTNSQHSFFQLLHQGYEMVPCEFMLAANEHESGMDEHKDLLVANCLAQSQALMVGRSIQEVIRILKKRGVSHEEAIRLAPHRKFMGNRPSTTILYKKLDPKTLGKMIALYEHRVFVEGVTWNLDSFDQWGVELGKELASDMLTCVNDTNKTKNSDNNYGEQDASTVGLLNTIKEWRD